MSRLQTRFAQLKQENRAALVTFVTAGDPDYASSLEILKGLPAAGADVIELGMPFTDPMADGPAIQLANIRALDGGQTLARTLQMVREFRSGDSETPLVLMGYFNPIHHYGVERFIAEAKEVGVDGLIVVDLPPEHNEDLCHPAQAAGLDFIRLTTPTTGDQGGQGCPRPVRRAGRRRAQRTLTDPDSGIRQAQATRCAWPCVARCQNREEKFTVTFRNVLLSADSAEALNSASPK